MSDWSDKEFSERYMTRSEQIPLQHLNNNKTEYLSSSPTSINQQKMCEKLISFCNEDNIDQSVSFINQELALFGFPTLSNSSGYCDIVCLINCLYELLQMHLKELKIQQQLENKYLRAKTDVEYLQSSHHQLKDDLEQCMRGSVSVQEKERQLQVVNKNLESALKQQKDEVKRLTCIMEQKHSQYVHEQRKTEREIDKLKERLHQLLNDKTREKRLGMEIINTLPRSDGKRSTWKTDNSALKQEEQLYKHIFLKYDVQHKNLLKENSDLRDSLYEVYREVLNLTHQPASVSSSASDNQMDEKETESIDDQQSFPKNNLSKEYFQMPYDLVRKEIEKTLRERIVNIKEQINDLQGQLSISSNHSNSLEKEKLPSEEVEDLKMKLKSYENVLEQQEKFIQDAIQSQTSNCNLSFLNDSNLIEEKEILAREKQLFYEQKANFEQERRNFTEAAIRLAKERKSFDCEKAAFIKQQFLESSPFKNRRASLTDLASLGKFTPNNVFLNTPKGIGKSPTTEEFYKFISALDENPKSSHKIQNADDATPFQDLNFISNNWKDSCKRSTSISKINQHRIMDHIENVKQALFKKPVPGSSKSHHK